MQALLYLNLASKKASESLKGTGFKFPPLTYGEDINLSIRLAQRLNGKPTEISRTVQELRASIGKIDERPESGKVKLHVGDEAAVDGYNVTAEIAHNAKASVWQAALEALTDVTFGSPTVEEKSGSMLVTFADEVAAVEIVASSNSLFPLSFLRVRASEFNGQFVHDVRLIQAPVSSTDISARVVPPAPTVSTLIDGGENDQTQWPEVQKLFIPPTFRGVYQVRRGFAKTKMLDRSDSFRDIGEAINASLTTDGLETFETSLPTDNSVHIAFGGSMIGVDQDELEVEVFDAPEGDITFTLNLNTPELHALLRSKSSVTLPLEIEADIEDENDSQVVYTIKLLSTTVTISRELHYEELSTVASVDWQRPPLPKDYVPFQATQVSNGQIHYATANFGDGTVGPYVFDHNLNTPRVDVIIFANSSSGEPLKQGTLAEVTALEADFGFSRVTDNSLEVTFAVGQEPAYNDNLATVLGLEQTSFFDAHTHSIAEIINLQTVLDDLGSRLADIETKAGGGTITVGDASDNGASLDVALPEFLEVFPSRTLIESAPERLIDIKTEELGRARGLLAAVHDAAVEVLPSTIPTAADAYIGRVFENTSGATVLLAGGKGHRTAKLKAGEFAACDGRLWYPVARYGEPDATDIFATDFATDANQLDAVAHEFNDGEAVQVSTTDTLPAPLVAGTDYFIANALDDSVELALTRSGTPIILTTDGVGDHSIDRLEETTFYPTNFQRELFKLHVNEEQFRRLKTFEVRFAIEAAVLKSNTEASLTLAIEIGEKTAVSSPATVGENIAGITWNPTPLLSQEIIVTPFSTIHRFGAQISRAYDDEITATALLYGATKAGSAAPATPNFALRARLVRFDTIDGESDPLGFMALKGLTLDTETSEAPLGEARAIII